MTSPSSPSEPSRPLLALDHVTIAHGRQPALKDVAFTVAPRTIVALAGPSGGGRSSLVLAIAGVLRPRDGGIAFEGRPVIGLGPDRVARLGLSHPESQRIFPEATVEENLRRAAAQRLPEPGVAGRGVVGDLERWLDAFPRLGPKRRVLARSLDQGAQTQLALARGLMARPRLLLADDPFAGQSADDVAATASALRAARDEEGLAVLYTDAWPLTVPTLPDRVLKVEGGRVTG